MKVTAKQGKNGSMIATFNGALLIFDSKAEQPTAGEVVDVMITHAPRRRDNGSIGFLFVRPITADDILVNHRGFECSGSMCSTSAAIEKKDAAMLLRLTRRNPCFLTPGRTPVSVVDNVNVGWNRQTYVAPKASEAYVAIADIRANLHRICGVASFEQIDPEILEGLTGYRSERVAA